MLQAAVSAKLRLAQSLRSIFMEEASKRTSEWKSQCHGYPCNLAATVAPLVAAKHPDTAWIQASPPALDHFESWKHVNEYRMECQARYLFGKGGIAVHAKQALTSLKMAHHHSCRPESIVKNQK